MCFFLCLFTVNYADKIRRHLSIAELCMYTEADPGRHLPGRPLPSLIGVPCLCFQVFQFKYTTNVELHKMDSWRGRPKLQETINLPYQMISK